MKTSAGALGASALAAVLLLATSWLGAPAGAQTRPNQFWFRKKRLFFAFFSETRLTSPQKSPSACS